MTFVDIIKLKNTVNFPSPKHVFPCFPVSINASQLSKPETLQSVDSPLPPFYVQVLFLFPLSLPGPVTLVQVIVSLLSYNFEARLLVQILCPSSVFFTVVLLSFCFSL